ncbi:cilia- and flagella-associated protein 57 isoform X2 [Nerophis ophidion]|uniref:cilia- and flagella-associated protein 57 isoform X2 n=1 Tax=Nerophis ophidion TaxID=159077 RepID=UPI002ADF326A|nr:cilia- and flagella-associated protein 57 isoform X2 [Nerophis ophidion]
MANVLAQSFLFGLQTDASNNLLFYDDQTIIFPCGKTCVCYNFVHQRQTFLSASEKSQGICAMAISPNRRFLAVSERGSQAAITVFDLQDDKGRKRKLLSSEDIVGEEFVCMAFSPNSKYLLAQTSGPEWTLVLWLWEKQKVASTKKMTNANNPVNQVSFNPYNNTHVCVTGSGVFQVLCYSEGTLKQTSSPKVESVDFVCHAWIAEDQVMTATSTGRLLVFQNGDLHWEMDMAALEVPDSQVEMKKSRGRDVNQGPALFPITALVKYSKGFACSTGPDAVGLYEKTAKNTYRKSKEILIPRHRYGGDAPSADYQQISRMCMSPSEETLAVSTDRGRLYGINMSSVLINKDKRLHFEALSLPFHSKSITDVSVCTWKPIVATSSLDRSVCIWNYETKMLEVFKEFQEQPYSVALHPTGLFILVGFSDKLQLMGLHMDDICTLKDFTIQSCRECSFSHGGHLFAAASGNVIHIYSLTSFQNIHNLKGHNGMICDVKWSKDDSLLVSRGIDGVVYEWNTQTGKRESNSSLKTSSYTSVAFSSDGRSVLALSTDHTLKELQAGQILRQVPVDNLSYTTMAVSHSGNVVFTGTDTGNIGAVKFPLPCEKEWMIYHVHGGPVTKMVVSCDDQFLLTVSEDNCLALWRILNDDDCGLKANKHIEETLINKACLEDKSQKMLELKLRLQEIEMENEYGLRLREMKYNEKMRESHEKFTKETETLKKAQQEMTASLEKQEVVHQQRCEELIAKHVKEVEALESSYSRKLIVEHEKYQDVQNKCEKMQLDFSEQLKIAAESKAREVEKLSQLHEVQLQEKTQLLVKCQRDKEQQSLKFKRIIEQSEEDEVKQIHDIQIKYERKLLTEQENNKELQEEASIMKQKLSSLQRQIDDRQSDIGVLKQERQKLLGLIRSLEDDIKDLKWQNCGQKKTNEDKDKTIFDLQKKLQELEKLKFLLDFQLSELKKQIEPQRESINEKKERIQQLEEEVVRMDKDNSQMKMTISELKLKLKARSKAMQQEMQNVSSLQTHLRRLQADLQECVGFIQEPSKLKKSVKMICARYVLHNEGVDKSQSDVCKTFTCKREVEEKTAQGLKPRLSKSANAEDHHRNKSSIDEDHHKIYNKIMKENVKLIAEVNELRRELCQTRRQVKDSKTQLDVFKRSINSVSTQEGHHISRNEHILHSLT